MNTYTEFSKIYLDACCLIRFFDAQTQERVRNETQAIAWILSRVYTGNWFWVASEVLRDEVNQGLDLVQRDHINEMLTCASQTISVGAMEIARAKSLEVLGFKRQDALHLACAESGSADIFFTTDDRLLKSARRVRPQIHMRVENPYTWLIGVTQNEHTRNADAGDA